MLINALLPYPQLDPVIISLGPLAIRWYAVAYIAGVFLGWWLLQALNRRGAQQSGMPALLNEKALDDITLYAILGIIIGGRLGYVLFYQPEAFLWNSHNLLGLDLPETPQNEFMREGWLGIPAMWNGGMSFHGGFLGMLGAMWLFVRRFRIPYLALMDLIAVCAPIGLFFGRMANFINGELWGRMTEVPWAMIFPTGGPVPRHPSQLYEAAMEGIALFAILLLLAVHTRIRHYRGALSGLFLLGYGAARTIAEQFREPDEHLGELWGLLTMGQLLSAPMLLLGLFLVWRAFCGTKA